ncbi:hypothetical protein AC578_5064 [Pseudocercospora eumusae]|uniref:PSI domain-containing protein n=1 Tax=Pseudocercospora eumusae TaxID=321146 RepID=A0A139HIE9_9PEZI|nr:hypothetical protein AC578_5064 [Pseudocercospora eumusae]
MAFNATRNERTKACWKMQDCGSCINSKHGCGWCSSSFSCVPANSLLDPVSNHGICPLDSERFELRTKALGCGCSTTTLLSVIVTVFATIAALLLLYGIGLALKNLNPYLGSGQTAGWQIEVKDDGTRVAHDWYRGRFRQWIHSFWKPKANLSKQSEQEAVTERSRLLA